MNQNDEIKAAMEPKPEEMEEQPDSGEIQEPEAGEAEEAGESGEAEEPEEAEKSGEAEESAEAGEEGDDQQDPQEYAEDVVGAAEEPQIATSRLSEMVQGLLDENKKTQDRLLRTAADFENFKKRSRRDLLDRTKQAEDRVVLDFLPIVDNLERALAHAEGQGDAGLMDGVKMVHKQFLSTLERFGISAFNSQGQAFDPAFHEAVQQVHSDEPAGVICHELQKGYKRNENDRLVRPAMVVVSRGAAPEPAEAEEPQQEDQKEGIEPDKQDTPDNEAHDIAAEESPEERAADQDTEGVGAEGEGEGEGEVKEGDAVEEKSESKKQQRAGE